jgi:hypothetical protein
MALRRERSVAGRKSPGIGVVLDGVWGGRGRAGVDEAGLVGGTVASKLGVGVPAREVGSAGGLLFGGLRVLGFLQLQLGDGALGVDQPDGCLVQSRCSQLILIGRGQAAGSDMAQGRQRLVHTEHRLTLAARCGVLVRRPLDYDNWHLYRVLQAAREQGRVSVFCLGIGLDTLTLGPTILTVAVFDGDVFDDLFGEAVHINAEGVLIAAAEASTVSEGLPFTAATVRRLLQDEPMASTGACILDRAWHFRDKILAR